MLLLYSSVLTLHFSKVGYYDDLTYAGEYLFTALVYQNIQSIYGAPMF